jgi:hypothetical protein
MKTIYVAIWFIIPECSVCMYVCMYVCMKGGPRGPALAQRPRIIYCALYLCNWYIYFVFVETRFVTKWNFQTSTCLNRASCEILHGTGTVLGSVPFSRSVLLNSFVLFNAEEIDISARHLTALSQSSSSRGICGFGVIWLWPISSSNVSVINYFKSTWSEVLVQVYWGLT